MNGPMDQTGYGFSSGGFSPTPVDREAARRNKAEMDRMSDFMQKLDPVLNRTLETLARTQVRNGATPEEARRSAFGSSSGQLMSDTMLGLRRAGFLGNGDPITYGRNIMQGVAGGGFQMDVTSPGAAGRNQSVMGGGLLSGHVGQQLAKDVMTNIYGAGSTDPRQAYGANMEDTSAVFRKLAERGALGNVGELKNYGADKGTAKNINEKIAIARRQEVDPLVRDALNGVTAENIDSKIAEAKKRGDTQIEAALKDIKIGESSMVLNDQNTKRITDITKEALKGIANLKDIYGELNSDQLIAQMESLTGIRATNQAEYRKASNMTRGIINTAEATGNDPRAVMSALIARRDSAQQTVANIYGEELGQGGTRSEIGKQVAAGMSAAAMESALRQEASSRGVSTRMNDKFGTNIQEQSRDEILADNTKQNATWAEQNKALALASGLANSTFSGDKEFGAAYREALADAERATTPEERRAANAKANRLIQSRMGVGADQYLKTKQGALALAEADQEGLMDASNVASASAAQTYVSDNIAAGTGANKKTVSAAFKSRLGVTGMEKLAGKSKAARDAQIKKFVAEGYLSEEQAAEVMKNMDNVTDKQFAEQMSDVGNSSGANRSLYDIDVGNAEAESRINEQQKGEYSNGKELSLKSIANSILTDPDKQGLNTDTKRLYALEAMQKAGLADGLSPMTRVNMEDGFDAEELQQINDAAGADLDIAAKLGFGSMEEMIEAQKKDDSVARNIKKAIDKSGKLMSGGTLDDTYFANADERDKITERAKRFELAAKYGELSGVEMGDDSKSWSAAQKEIMETGKLSKGGIGLEFETDAKGQKVYDNDGDTSEGWFNINWNDEETNPEDKVHLKNANKMTTLAARVNSKEEGADMIALNNLGGGSLQDALETQLETLKEAQGKGAVTIDTKDADGNAIRQDMGATIEALTAAIDKLKSDDGETKQSVTKHMTVEVMEVKRRENK